MFDVLPNMWTYMIYRPQDIDDDFVIFAFPLNLLP